MPVRLRGAYAIPRDMLKEYPRGREAWHRALGILPTRDAGTTPVPRVVTVSAEGLPWPAKHCRSHLGGVVAPW